MDVIPFYKIKQYQDFLYNITTNDNIKHMTEGNNYFNGNTFINKSNSSIKTIHTVTTTTRVILSNIKN